jgi:hypothetical protein
MSIAREIGFGSAFGAKGADTLDDIETDIACIVRF